VFEITEFAGKKGQYFFGSVKVGERGQIVIPLKARETFGIDAGDEVYFVGELNKGLGISKVSEVNVKKLEQHEYYFGIAKVGERGQVVIPQEARVTFEINSADLILVFGDIKRGLGLMKASKLKNFAIKLFQAVGGNIEDFKQTDGGNSNNEE
jgi:AbrB family looped-hinge helix DNA binding protein